MLKLQVKGVGKAVSTTDKGEYWRLLSPGETYRLRAVSSDGKTASEWKSVTLEDGRGGEAAVRLDFELNRAVAAREVTPRHAAWRCNVAASRLSRGR